MIEIEIFDKPTVKVNGKKKTFKTWEEAVLFAFKTCMTSDADEIRVDASKSRFRELLNKK